MESETKKGIGCLGMGCIGALVLLLVLIGGGYYAVLHTSLPLKLALAPLSKSDDVTIEGISGSLSKGFDIALIKFKMDGSNFSIIENMGFSYSLSDLIRHDRLVIYSIHVKRAHLFFPKANSEEHDEPESEPEKGKTVERKPIKEQLFDIQQVDLNDVTIEIAESNFRLQLDKIHLDGMKNDAIFFSSGPFTIKSNYLNLETTPFRADKEGTILGSKPFELKGALKAAVHESILQDIVFQADSQTNTTGKTYIDYSLMDGKVHYHHFAKGKVTQVEITDLTMDDYFKDFMPGKKIHLSAATEKDDDNKDVMTIKKGSIDIGLGHFEIPEQVFYEKDFPENKNPPILAHTTSGQTKFSASIHLNDDGFSCSVALSAEPEMKLDEIVARLYFDRAVERLSSAEKREWEKHRARFVEKSESHEK